MIRSRKIVATIVSTVAGAAAWQAPSPDAAASSATLAFIRSGKVHVAVLGSSTSRRLTSDDGEVSEIAWSPDGRRIALVRLYEGQSYSGPSPSEIYVVGAGGEGLRRVTTRLLDIQGITWSPDGTRIAFRQRERGIFVMTARGDDLRQLVPRLLPTTDPAWSPDGRGIAVSGATSGGFPPKSAIYTVDPGGRNLRRLTRNANDTMPIWSPDGRRIVYQRNRCVPSFCGSVIRVMNADGSATRSLVRVAGGAIVAWAPHGRTIAFERPGKVDREIWTMSADGTHPRKLATDTYGPGLAWSPDGKWIAFVRNNSIFVMNANGTGQRRVIPDGTAPAWRPVP